MAEVYEVLSDLNSDSPVYGIPEYNGMEYDFEVPSDQVVASPGGTSDIHHHWTKGFYGLGGSSFDVFGNEPPADVYGVTGDLYATGPTATQTWAPGPGGVYPAPPVGTSPEFLGAQAGPRPPPEPFNNDDNIEFVDAVDPFLSSSRERFKPVPVEGFETSLDPEKPHQDFSVRTVFVLLFGWLAFSFWTQALTSFLKERFYTQREIPAFVTAILAALFTIVFIRLAWSQPRESLSSRPKLKSIGKY